MDTSKRLEELEAKVAAVIELAGSLRKACDESQKEAPSYYVMGHTRGFEAAVNMLK